MSLFSFLKPKQRPTGRSGNVDPLFANAIIIDAQDSTVGIRAEKDYIAAQCGERQKDWTLKEQSLAEYNGKPYDVIVVALRSGETRTFCFDTSKFFGK